ncbi:hypothetical protein LOTGIDRAFT_166205 [Lottia gigantea]|uniref:Uncharacterized protein n=1 Tax=Lottia gigantea TaxID=225164 RepID=V3ZU72_LOTGI|nr:hypothetical protein LOTGIDRAFT_166205 [Lottia gigantea]ESO87902.1 hypothetical protein LOTGIDRAFT_166205 [Lottia gigantea]
MDWMRDSIKYGGWFVFTVSLLFQNVVGVMDKEAGCTNPAPQPAADRQPTKPTLPNTYEVHIECIIMNKNQSTEVHEFFDYDGNRGAIRQRQEDKCIVTDLGKTAERFLFGYSTAGSGDHIFSAAGALHFGGDVVETYVGKDVTRGIGTRSWYSCQYWKNMDATMDVWWYFSDPDNWDTALGLPEIPIRAHVKGIAYSPDGVSHTFEHIYDFVHFKNYIEETNVFETPSMVICPNRKNTKVFPQLPDAFSFTVEIVDLVRKSVSFMTEAYDKSNNVTRLHLKPSELESSPYGFRPLTQIHDFNTGVAYIMDDMYGNCSIIPIQPDFVDNKISQSGYVKMRTSNEFFDVDNVKLTYEGVKTTRNIPCDTWVGRRTTVDAVGTPMNVTWEWYFKTDDWTSVEQTDEVSSAMGSPVQIRYQYADYDEFQVYNFYGFSQEHQDLMNYDISQCYNNNQKIKIDFQIPGKYQKNAEDNRILFLYSTLVSLAGYMDVSPLRISHIQLVNGDDNLHVQFDLLDAAPLIGDIQILKRETPLQDAVLILKKAIDSNDLVILLVSETEQQIILRGLPLLQVIPITVVQGSMVSYTYGSTLDAINSKKSSDYGPGSMAGLAVGMIACGGLMGVLMVIKFF